MQLPYFKSDSKKLVRQLDWFPFTPWPYYHTIVLILSCNDI